MPWMVESLVSDPARRPEFDSRWGSGNLTFILVLDVSYDSVLSCVVPGGNPDILLNINFR